MSKRVTFTQVNKKGELEEVVLKTSQKTRKKGWSTIPPAYYNLGMYLAIPLLLAIIAGKYIDGYFKTGSLFTLLLIIFGTISAFYNLVRLLQDDGTTHKH